MTAYFDAVINLHSMHFPAFNTTEAEEQFFRFAKGDEVAFAWMYKGLYPPLVRYGCRIVADEFEVSVMAQEAFLCLWDHRARMTSVLHAWRFLRLGMRWKCYTWLRQEKGGIRFACSRTAEAIAAEDPAGVLLQEQQYEEKRRLVLKALPYLPPKKQLVVKLYFHYGFGCRQIARQLGRTGSGAVSRELHDSIRYLRAVLRLAKKAAPAPVKKAGLPEGRREGLSTEQETVFRLRYEEKKSFSEIAGLTGVPQPQAEQAYIRAWVHLRNHKTTGGNG